MAKSFIPTLDDPQHDILKDPVKMLEYMIAFMLINPGNTSDLHERDMVSLGTTHMEHGDKPHALAAEYEQKLQDMLDVTIPDVRYSATVAVINVSDIEAILEFSVTDSDGRSVIQIQKDLNKIEFSENSDG